MKTFSIDHKKLHKQLIKIEKKNAAPLSSRVKEYKKNLYKRRVDAKESRKGRVPSRRKPSCYNNIDSFYDLIKKRSYDRHINWHSKKCDHFDIPIELYQVLLVSFLKQQNVISRVHTDNLKRIRDDSITPNEAIDLIDVEIFKRLVLGEKSE
jgi:hypothetical protein